MKSIKNVLSLSLIFLILMGCEDNLLQASITDRESSKFFSNESEIESAVIAVYATLQDDDLYGLDLIIAGEISSDDAFDEVPANAGGRYGQLDEFTTFAGNGLVEQLWEKAYIAIQRANVILNRIGDIDFEDEAIKRARVGEMEFVRALMYFNLVQLYGDVPLVIVETRNPNDFFGQGRTAQTQVYSQIEADLNSAISNLPEINNPGRPGQGAAEALLAKVLLTQGRFGDALPLLESVVNSGVYALVNDVSAIFGIENENNSEVLFAVQFASALDGNREGSRAFSEFSPAGTVSNAKGHNLPTVDFYNLFDDADLRKTEYVSITEVGIPFTKKFSVNPSNSQDGGSDFVVIRYSEVVLMLAEALNETGNTAEAGVHLNSIRARAGLTNTAATSQDAMREAIRLERRFELTGEGHRWFDLKRYGNAVETMNTWFVANGINRMIDANHLVLPIPQSQIDTDPAITQNPGY